MYRQIRALALGAGFALALSAAARAEGELFIYNWFDYTPPELIEKFEQEYDVSVTLDTYDSNETLLAKLVGGGTGYDVAMPGDYMVAIMIREGLLEKVQPNQMENFKNLDPRWVDVYWDPGREYSIPWQWGTTAFMVDREVYDGDIDTLAMIFDPPEPLRGEINMLRDVNDVLNMGLRHLGHPRCNDNEEQLRELNELMQNSKQYWKSFNSDGAKEVLVSGDVQAGMIWNGFGMRARLEKPVAGVRLPQGGLHRLDGQHRRAQGRAQPGERQAVRELHDGARARRHGLELRAIR